MIKKLIKRLLKIFNYQLLNLENQEINLFSKEDVFRKTFSGKFIEHSSSLSDSFKN